LSGHIVLRKSARALHHTPQVYRAPRRPVSRPPNKEPQSCAQCSYWNHPLDASFTVHRRTPWQSINRSATMHVRAR
jgi:hypothetical protein